MTWSQPQSSPGATQHRNAETLAAIRKRAFEIYQARKGGPGDATGDWLRAEREILGTGEASERNRTSRRN